MNIYLDNQATTRMDDRVLLAMKPYLTNCFGNPSTDSSIGFTAKVAVTKAREHVAELINGASDDIFFTSGATESLNWAIRGAAEKAPIGKNNIVTTTIEHNAILKTCEFLEKHFHFTITKVAPQKNGIIEAIDIEKAITPHTFMVAVQHANNEIGTIQPIKEIGEICRKAGVLFLVDAAQSIGKIICDVTDFKIDLLAASGHKIYAPKGIGFLYINDNIKHKVNPLIYGGGQESGFRSGTHNVPCIVGLGEACRICQVEMQTEAIRLLTLRNELIQNISTKIPTMQINGCINRRLPGNINFSVPGVSSDVLLRNITEISISKGSACNSSKQMQSHVLLSLTQDDDKINSAIRIGIGRFNTMEEIHIAATKIATAIDEIKTSNAQF